MRVGVTGVVLAVLALSALALSPPSPKLDLDSCKLSHSGVDYRGTISRSFSGPRCRAWDSRGARSPRIGDADFPDGSRRAAANKCRNPTGASVLSVKAVSLLSAR